VNSNIVIDTNVVVAALKSSRGASFRMLSMVEHERFVMHLSTPLVTEYEAVLKRGLTTLSPQEIDDVIDFLCAKAVLNKIFYLWRPLLKDPGDDFVLELAVKSGATIVTWNTNDFKPAARFGIAVLNPRDFLASLEKQP
jgi:putative PIN family toxin of toxin-antitoxin system